MTQEMCDKIVFKEPFMLKYHLDRYKTQEMCDKAIDFYLLTLKFVPDWFATSKIIEELDNAIFFNDDIVSGDIDSDIVTFFSNGICLKSINLNNINTNHDNFDDHDPETIRDARLMGWYNRYKQAKNQYL